MQVDQVREALNARPFRPFTLRTAEGSGSYIPHPEFLWIKPGAQRMVVVGMQDSEAYVVIDLLLVSVLEFMNGAAGAGGNGRPEPQE